MGVEGTIAGRAADLSPLVAKYRAYSEEHGRLAPEVVDACREAGLFLLNAPVEAGGLEATPREIVETVDVIARADPSVSWYLTNSMAACHAAAWIDPSYWDRIYRAGRGNFGFSAAPGGRLAPADGGFVMSGQWPLVTGVSDAGWAALNCLVEDPDGGRPALRMALVATEGLEIDEIWQDAVAMKGTGSHRVSAEDCFVPSGLVVDFNEKPSLDRDRYSLIGVAHVGGLANAAVAIAILDCALAATAAELREKVSTISGVTAADSGGILELLAGAQLELWNLRSGALSAADALWEHVMEGRTPPPEVRAIAAGAQFQSAAVARRTISELYARSSRAAFFGGHPLEQSLRDIHAVSYGFEPLRPIHHDVGRIALGLEPRMPIF